MSLPIEIIELILTKCDGRTLLAAKKVSNLWKQTVEYLEGKLNIWEKCCKEEIPERELVDYLNSYNKKETDIWSHIYKNWVSWQNMENIQFEIVLCPTDISRITCIDVIDDYIAVGSEDGRVKVFDNYWRQLHCSRHQAERVTKITFFYSPNTFKQWFAIAYPKCLIFDHVLGHDGINYAIVEDVKAHSIYRDHICYQKNGGRLTIERMVPEEIFLRYVWFARIYSPSNITCLNLWNGVCTVLVDNDVKEVKYEKDVFPMASLERKCLVQFSFPNTMASIHHQIFRDNAIVVLYREEELRNEYMEIIIIEGENNYVKKLFNTSEVLEASITCFCLFGNTLAIGVDTGIMYLYHIPCWKQFHIREYQKRLIIGRHPITNIVVKESKKRRTFYVCSSFGIHEVTGYIPFDIV